MPLRSSTLICPRACEISPCFRALNASISPGRRTPIMRARNSRASGNRHVQVARGSGEARARGAILQAPLTAPGPDRFAISTRLPGTVRAQCPMAQSSAVFSRQRALCANSQPGSGTSTADIETSREALMQIISMRSRANGASIPAGGVDGALIARDRRIRSI